MEDNFVCPDCGGDQVIAQIARRVGHRPDVAFAAAAKAEEEVKKYKSLYHAVNEMMARLGADGEINTESHEVISVMDALYEIDHGEYVQEN